MRLLLPLLVFCTLLHPAKSTWWYLSQFDQKSLGERRGVCDITPNLNRKQRQICNRNPELIRVIGNGVQKGLFECQFQFRYQRWNCSTFVNDSSLFGRSLVRGGTREIAYLQAVTSASAIYKLARTCSKGHPKCGCSAELPPSKYSNSTKNDGVFKWEGCEQVVKFSTNFVRRFVDAPEIRQTDGKAKLTLHNNRVGRIMVRRSLKRTCKCHGLSGSCSMQTCWNALPNFRIVGKALRDKFDSAIEITFKPSGRIVPANINHRKPDKYNLIYYEKSPDFCKINETQGSLGTHNRICQNTTEGEESCDILCCTQKYTFTRIHYPYHCNCTFTWCCQVDCETCNGTRTEYRCK